SLSPEQQQFARAFRAMQLESTLFAVCIVQIKPQLEALLNLPPDSLTKEIKLTQDLLSLFIDYQIPSDLISYDGRADASPEHKLARVHEHVAKMLTMIAQSRAREIDEAREQEKLRLAESNMTPYGPMPPPSPLAVLSFATPALGGTSQSRREAECLEAMPPMAPPSLGAPPPPAAPPPPPSPARKAAPRPAPGQVSTTAAAPLPPAAPKLHQTPFPRTREAPPTEPGDLTDYTRIPAVLDRRFEEIDEDAALRPTLLNPGDPWKKTAQKGLLSEPVTTTLGGKEQETEKNKAFDLLDALSRSGTLPIHHASLHVVLAATHCFDQTLIDTVIQGNVNPIEKVERSLMIMATTIHNRPAAELIAPDQQERFFSASPQLLKEPLQPPLPNGQE
ncbi:MAG: hypothetical protein RMJ98_06045, partial [Myxococcales bacterium]|nr:hypothetical protein [Polyangiaceae bacterium]MDW8248850.1 hypothetical protein [Myxococcales bacterium]